MTRFNRRFTALLWIILIVLIMVLWSLFISGPNRIKEEQERIVTQKIEKKVDGIQGLSMHLFDYQTYQGYTDSKLYWFDANGDIITTRKMEELDYDKASKTAKKEYDVDTAAIYLGYGYDNPCYVIEGKDTMILIDFDTYVKVFERELR